MNHRRKSLDELTQYFDGENGAQGGGPSGGGADAGKAGGGGADVGSGTQTGGGLPPVFNAREHLDDSGSFKGDWWKAAGVPETVGRKFNRPEAVARAYGTLETQFGKKGVIVPGANATQQEKDAYYAALGRPGKPEEYGFAKPERVKVGDKEVAVPERAWDQARATAWQNKLHELGVSKEQANGIMRAAVEESVVAYDGLEGAKAQMQQASAATLKKEFGADYDAKMGAAARAAKEFGGDELVNHPGLGNDPVMIKALAKIGEAMGERQGAGVRQSAGKSQPNASEAREQALAMTKTIAERSKAERGFLNTPEGVRMAAEKTRLFQLAYPEGR
jgi:hypothetical protein